MFKKLFSERPTTRTDVVMAVAGAALGIFKAWDTAQKYKAAQQTELNKEN